ncbi:hypothetical protein SNEBB_007740 [Seison nebaliae]|nr:hypothetical protein SNEBB_007740 [Seison nebaliae]
MLNRLPYYGGVRRPLHLVSQSKRLIWLNMIVILLGILAFVSFTIVWGIFEEFTIWTYHTIAWIEYNYYIHFWDRITVTRTIIIFLWIYGIVTIGIGSYQMYALRNQKLEMMWQAPKMYMFIGIITFLGACCWLVVTAANSHEGYIRRGADNRTVWERVRFKGNVFKDLVYMQQTFERYSSDRVPNRNDAMKIFIDKYQREFRCCGWSGPKDYSIRYRRLPGMKFERINQTFLDVVDSCCVRKRYVVPSPECGKGLIGKDSNRIYQEGCGPKMKKWYRRGFIENIVMATFGLLWAIYLFIVAESNKRRFFEVCDKIEDMQSFLRPGMSMSTVSKASTHAAGRYRVPRPTANQLNNSKRPEVKTTNRRPPTYDQMYSNPHRQQQHQQHPLSQQSVVISAEGPSPSGGAKVNLAHSVSPASKTDQSFL